MRAARNVFAAVAAIAFVWALVLVSRAHAAEEPNYFKSWIKGLTSPQGKNCCDISDCHHTVAEHRSGDWWARVPAPDGPMTEIPRGVIIYNKPSPDGEAYVCHSTYAPVTIYCFVPPNMGF